MRLFSPRFKLFLLLRRISSTSIIISHLISWSILFLCVILSILALYLFYSYRKEYDPEMKTVTMEYFSGVKNTKWARLYPFLLLSRRVFFVCIIIFMSGNVHRAYIYTIALIFQVVYLGVLICLRPLKEAQDNSIELTNEVWLTVFICYLFSMSREEKWTDTSIDWFMYLLIVNMVMVLAIMILFIIMSFIAKNRASKNRIKPHPSQFEISSLEDTNKNPIPTPHLITEIEEEKENNKINKIC